MNQHLFLMLGYPGSGKSTFARQLADRIKAVRLNGDGARHSMFTNEVIRRDPANNPIVFGALDYAAQQVIHAGYSVLYDASHNKISDRVSKELLGEPHSIKPIIIWIQVPVEEAKARLGTRELLPDQPVISSGRFEELIAAVQPPEPHELYIEIDGTRPFTEQMELFSRQLQEILDTTPSHV